MADFETYLDKLQKAEGLDRGQAISRLSEAVDNNDPQISKISGLTEGLAKERIKSIGEHAGLGILEGVTAIPERIMSFVPGSETFESPTETVRKKVEGTTEKTPYAEGAGQLVGGATAFAAPFAGGEEAITAVGERYGLPWLTRNSLMPGKGLLATLGKAGVVGGALNTAMGGDFQTGFEYGVGGRLAEPIIGAVAGKMKEKLGSVFTRTPKDTPVDVEFSKVPPEPETPGELPSGGPTEPTEPGPIAKPPTSTSGEVEPWVPPSGGSVKNPLVKFSPDEEYVGTRDVTTGQPFSGTKTVRLQEGTYVNPTHEAAGIGEPWPISLVKPAVLKVANSPYRDALEKLFPNSPKILAMYDSSSNPEGAAREIIGRYAKRNKFDGVILKHDDMSKDIILDFRDFESSPLKEFKGMGVGKDVLETKPPKSVFARALEPRGFYANFPRPLPNEAFWDRSAVKHNGRIYEGLDKAEDHFGIVDRHNITSGTVVRGFIGHDGKFYSDLEMEQKSAAYVRRYGQPAPDTKVNFSETPGFQRAIGDIPQGTGTAEDTMLSEDIKQNILAGKGLGDLSRPENLDTIAHYLGWQSAKHLANDIKAAKYSPFEMLQHAAKADTEAPPVYMVPLVKDVEPASVGLVREVVQAVANRYPRLFNIISRVEIKPGGGKWLAQTGIQTDGTIYMEIAADSLPGTETGEKQLAKYGFKPNQWREFLSTTVEHELTHAAQYWADVKGLSRTFNVPSMGVTQRIDAKTRGAAEDQAMARDEALQTWFAKHDQLTKRVGALPEDVITAVLRHDIDAGRTRLKPQVLRKFNQLSGRHTAQYFMKEKKPDFTPDDMDIFDGTSRDGPLGSEVTPDQYFSPEVKAYLGATQKVGMKWGGFFSRWRNSWDVSDNPDHLYLHAQIFDNAHKMNVVKARFLTRYGKILKEYGATNENFDKLGEAIEGLRRAPDGYLYQTIKDVDEKTAKAAIQIRERVYDAAFEHVTGISRKAPVLLEEYGLKQSPAQWWRLKLLQTPGMRAKVKNPTVEEFNAATRMQGMLNFDESNDLRMEHVDGYLTHQPIANERAMLMDDIDQLTKMAKLSGVWDQPMKDALDKKVARLQEIEINLAKAYVQGGPRTDVVPKRHYFGPALIRDNPHAAEVVVDKHLPTVIGRYINGIVTKRYFDQVLHDFSKVSKNLPGSVRTYNVEYINNLRGLRGFKEDQQLVNFLNEVAKLAKSKERYNINEIRRFGEINTQLQTVFKLLAGNVRFPAVQMTHMAMTTYPAAGARSLIKGLSHVWQNPGRSFKEVMARGLIEKDAEFMAQLDKNVPAGGEGNIISALQWLPKMADYFRKTVTWHTFKLKALEPGFKPDMNLAKTFVKDVPGRSVIQTANEYADAMTTRTQFDLRAHGKPTGFVGGQIRRSMTQFKPWMINYGTFYKDVMKGGEVKQRARLLAALYFVGGPTAILGGDLLYNLIRHELLKFGFILPQDTGFQQAAKLLGWGHLMDVDILSLRDPIGLPKDKSNIIPWGVGPAAANVGEVLYDVYNDWGEHGKMFKDVLGDTVPPARAALDAIEEWHNAGVKSPTGQLLGRRPPASVVIRGLDLSPSLKSQRYNFRNDIITAYENGHPETARKLLQQAHDKGIVFGPRDMRQIRSTVKSTLKKQRLPFAQQMR